MTDNLYSLLQERFLAASAKPSLIDADGHGPTYGQLDDLSARFASVLRAYGVEAGDRIVVQVDKSVGAMALYLGCLRVGAIFVPLNTAYTAAEVDYFLGDSEPRLFVSRSLRDAAADHVLVMGTTPDSPLWAEALAAQPDPAIAPRTASDIAAILYTSGTTGRSKGAMLSHGNLLANAEAVVEYLGIGPDDSVLDVLPFYYAYGASVLHTHLIRGARIVLAPSMLFPNLVVDALRREAVTGFSAVPSTFALLLERGRLDGLDAPALRYLTQAGGAMSPALTRRVRDALPGPRLFVMYGQTEATSRLTYLPPERLDDKPGSVGRPLAGVEIAVLRDDGQRAATGEDGEVCARGPNVMLGYWDNTEATAITLRDGWLHTGDIGHLDADGDLFLAGRRSDMIKTGAHRVNPADVEEAIAELPWVIEAAVVGVDDAVLGQVIKACVVVSDLPPRADDRIRAHCRAQLAPYKVPKFVQFIDALPRTASGKVRRVQLMETQSP